MNDERLTELVSSLRYERMGRAADARTKQRLEAEWAALRERGGSWRRTLARAIIGLGFVALVAFTVLRAPGDSPLYGMRVAVEDAFANVYADPQARVEYLLDLYDQRQAEAARLEAMGSAASGGARRIEEKTLATLRSLLPQAPEDETPQPAPSPSPQTSPSASPSPTPTAVPSASTVARATTPAETPRPQPTTVPTPRATQAAPALTARPTPTPVKTDLYPIVLNGTVVDANGAPAREICVSVVAGDCQSHTTTAGVYRLTVAARPGQTVTVYAWISDATGKILLKGTQTVTVKSSTIQVPTISLRPF